MDTRKKLKSLPKWQRYLIVAFYLAVAVAVVSAIHGVLAALLSAATALFLGWLLANADITDPRAFVDIQRPRVADIRFAIGGIAAILAVEIGLGLARAALSPRSDVASHDLTTTTAAQPSFEVVAIAVLAAVIVGPFVEELLFRNGIQKLLTGHIGVLPAITLTSGSFAVLHVPSYGGFAAPVESLALPLTAIFASSCIFGYVYHRSGNVITAWIAHGGMNALALAVAFS